jgi:hypothetical protein
MKVICSIPAHLLHAFISVALAAMLTNSARAQGTLLFRNKSSTPHISAAVTDARNGQRVEGNAWTAQLYYTEGFVLNPRVLRSAQPATHFLTGAAAGYIQSVQIVFPDVGTNQVVTVQMRAWNTEAGNTYEEAASNPLGVVGESNLVTTTTGGGGRVPGELAGLDPFAVFPVPEPRSELLFFCALIGLCLLKRIASNHRRT